jgi:transposase
VKKNSTNRGLFKAGFVGLDLADKESTFVGIDGRGRLVEEGRVATTSAGLQKAFAGRRPSRIAIEVGTHSPWASLLIAEMGHEVIVANPRQVALIYRNKRKSDKIDATTLARLARSDPELLHPVKHRGKQAQIDLAVLRARDGLVAARTQLVNLVRGAVKSYGERLPKCSTESFHHKAAAALPADLSPALTPVIEQIAALTEGINQYDQEIERLIAERYPEALGLQQVKGVGPITSLAYVLTIEDPGRFPTSRDVGAYLGLTPGRRQTGESDPEMHITKAGDVFLRKLVVQAAQYILGPFGVDCDLRRWGLRLAGTPANAEGHMQKGSKQRKKRAIVAVARKLAVLLHALWRSGEVYEPLRWASRKEPA